METRQATTADVEILSTIVRNAYRTVAERYGLNGTNCLKHPSNCTPEWIAGDLERGVTYYLLESEGKQVGCAALEKADDELCYLERLAVLPEDRNRGAGRELVDHVFREAGKLGCSRISIGIIAKQLDLKNWYAKIGFQEGSTKTFEHLPFDVTFMERPLP